MLSAKAVKPIRNNLRYELIIFDFDGTLANSFPFFASIFNQLADRYRFRKVGHDEVEHLRHANPRQIMQYVGMPLWKLPLVSKSFIRHMKRNAHRIELFEQINDSLHYLAASGVKLAIVSSNSRHNIEAILGKDLFALFNPVYCGMSIFGKKSHLKKILKKTGIDPKNAIYIGDQETDAIAAAAANIDFGAVSWGYSSVQALRRHPRAIEFKHITELRNMI